MIFLSERNSKTIRLCLYLSVSILTACSSFDLLPSDSLIQRLRGRGAVLVSPDNPYLAGNLLLQQESKKSKELAGFLSNKGTPQALSVEQKLLESAKVNLYYKEPLEQYDMELLRGVWVINGPSAITDQSVRRLVSGQLDSEDIKILKPAAPEPSQAESAQEKQAEMVPIFDENQTVDSKAVEPESEDQNPVTEIQEAKIQETVPTALAEQPAEEPETSADSLNTDLQEPEALAETTPRGDIVHYVTSENETLSLISRWYTDSDLTLSRVAKANKLSSDAVLRPGDQVVIPAELVKNKQMLTEHAIETLDNSNTGETN